MSKKLCFAVLTLTLALLVSCRLNGSPFYRALISHEAKDHNEKNYGGSLSVGEVTFHGSEGEYRIKVADGEGAASDFSYVPKKNLLLDGYRRDCLMVWAQLRRAELFRALSKLPVEEVFVSYDFADYGFIAEPPEGQLFVSVLLREQGERESFSESVFQTVQQLYAFTEVADVNVCAPYREAFLIYRHRPETGRITLTKIQKGTKASKVMPFPVR